MGRSGRGWNALSGCSTASLPPRPRACGSALGTRRRARRARRSLPSQPKPPPKGAAGGAPACCSCPSACTRRCGSCSAVARGAQSQVRDRKYWRFKGRRRDGRAACPKLAPAAPCASLPSAHRQLPAPHIEPRHAVVAQLRLPLVVDKLRVSWGGVGMGEGSNCIATHGGQGQGGARRVQRGDEAAACPAAALPRMRAHRSSLRPTAAAPQLPAPPLGSPWQPSTSSRWQQAQHSAPCCP